MQGGFGCRLQLHVVDPAAFQTHQMVVVLLQRLCQLVPGDTIAAVVRGSHIRLRQHAQGAVYGGEGDRAVEVGVDLCGRHRAPGAGESFDDVAPARGKPNLDLTETLGDLIDDLRDGWLPSTLGRLLRTILIINMNLRMRNVLLAGLTLVAASCSSADTADGAVLVVVTTTVLGDVAANVVGDSAVVEVLIPLGVDPHDFQASARQVARMAEADLVVANGLGLEEGLGDVLASLGGDGHPVLLVGKLLGPLRLIEGRGPDPHIWLDPLRMVAVTGLIAGALEQVAPEGRWRVNADRYTAELEAADAEIQAILAAVPEGRRMLVTNHDSLGYFAERYDFEVIGVVVPGGSTLAQPSSADLAALVRVIEQSGVPAIFAETTEPASLAESIAAEVEDDVAVVELFIGSLGGPGSGAETYIEMLLTDANRIAEAFA